MTVKHPEICSECGLSFCEHLEVVDVEKPPAKRKEVIQPEEWKELLRTLLGEIKADFLSPEPEFVALCKEIIRECDMQAIRQKRDLKLVGEYK